MTDLTMVYRTATHRRSTACLEIPRASVRRLRAIFLTFDLSDDYIRATGGVAELPSRRPLRTCLVGSTSALAHRLSEPKSEGRRFDPAPGHHLHRGSDTPLTRVTGQPAAVVARDRDSSPKWPPGAAIDGGGGHVGGTRLNGRRLSYLTGTKVPSVRMEVGLALGFGGLALSGLSLAINGIRLARLERRREQRRELRRTARRAAMGQRKPSDADPD